MSIDALKSQIPSYAKDIKLNLSSSGNAEVIRQIEEEALDNLSAAAVDAAKAAAAIMAMNNVYYKFAGIMPEYQTLPAKLRMNVIGNPGVDKVDFELWSLAVSAINGCQFCVQSHEKILRDGGLSQEQVQTAVRVAAVVKAVAATLSGEAALSESEIAKAA